MSVATAPVLVAEGDRTIPPLLVVKPGPVKIGEWSPEYPATTFDRPTPERTPDKSDDGTPFGLAASGLMVPTVIFALDANGKPRRTEGNNRADRRAATKRARAASRLRSRRRQAVA